MKKYLFKTARLGFREWRENDVEPLVDINSDEEVMAFFPKKPSLEDTRNFVKRMQSSYQRKGFCYFAVDAIEKEEFIGFIGFAEKTFPSDFTPAIDIGWRLKRNVWNRGLATEGAKACLDYGFNHLTLTEIIAITPLLNIQSQRVMEKIGMKKVKNFEHPDLSLYPNLRNCVLFSITKEPYRNQNKTS